jgi:hypothetical protein
MEHYDNYDDLIKDILLGIVFCLAGVGGFFLLIMALGGEIIIK